MAKIWTSTEAGILTRLYPDCKTKTLIPIFHCDIQCIYKKANALKIRKSNGFMKSSLSGRIFKIKEN